MVKQLAGRFGSSHWKYYCRENYIIVIQDVRGSWMSEGEFVDVRPFIKDKKTNNDIDEASDTYDAIDWLVKNLTRQQWQCRCIWNFLSRFLFNNGCCFRSSCIKSSKSAGAGY